MMSRKRTKMQDLIVSNEIETLSTLPRRTNLIKHFSSRKDEKFIDKSFLQRGSILTRMNPGFVNDGICSMLSWKSISNLLLVSRFSNDNFRPNYRQYVDLRESLIGLTKHASQRSYDQYLKKAMNILHSQEPKVNKYLSYDLLIEYLPSLLNSFETFFILWQHLSREKKLLAVIQLIFQIHQKDRQDINKYKNDYKDIIQLTYLFNEFIKSGIFEMNDDEIQNECSKNSTLWNHRDKCFLDYHRIFRVKYLQRNVTESDRVDFQQIIDWFLARRYSEELSYPHNSKRFQSSTVAQWYHLIISCGQDFRENEFKQYNRGLWRVFLERGYYGPVKELKSSSQFYIYPTIYMDPILLAILHFKDSKLEATVTENYINKHGLKHLNNLKVQLEKWITPRNVEMIKEIIAEVKRLINTIDSIIKSKSITICKSLLD